MPASSNSKPNWPRHVACSRCATPNSRRCRAARHGAGRKRVPPAREPRQPTASPRPRFGARRRTAACQREPRPSPGSQAARSPRKAGTREPAGPTPARAVTEYWWVLLALRGALGGACCSSACAASAAPPRQTSKKPSAATCAACAQHRSTRPSARRRHPRRGKARRRQPRALAPAHGRRCAAPRACARAGAQAGDGRRHAVGRRPGQHWNRAIRWPKPTSTWRMVSTTRPPTSCSSR